LSANLELKINNTSAAVHEHFVVGGTTLALDVDPGPYVKVQATGLRLTIAGQTLTGDFAFESTTSAPISGPARNVVRVGAANVSLRLGDGAADFVRVTDGQGALILSDAGLAGTFGATVSVSIPGVVFSGSFTVSVNNTNQIVHEQFTVGS